MSGTDVKDQETGPLKLFFFFLGPIMASFHVATYIVGFFSIGAVAKWITDQWFPFTRWIWTHVLDWIRQYIELPYFSDVEKDALTTVFFFAPLGIYALVATKKHPLDDKYQIAAAVIGIFFVGVVGLRLISVVIGNLFYFDDGFIPVTTFGRVIFGMLTLVLILKVWQIFVEGRIEERILAILGSCIGFPSLSVLAVIAENVMRLSMITWGSFFAVGVLAAAAIKRTPYRLSWGLGSFIAFILSGILFEGLMIFARFVQSTNAPG